MLILKQGFVVNTRVACHALRQFGLLLYSDKMQSVKALHTGFPVVLLSAIIDTLDFVLFFLLDQLVICRASARGLYSGNVRG